MFLEFFDQKRESVNLKSVINCQDQFYLISSANSDRHSVYFESCFFTIIIIPNSNKKYVLINNPCYYQTAYHYMVFHKWYTYHSLRIADVYQIDLRREQFPLILHKYATIYTFIVCSDVLNFLEKRKYNFFILGQNDFFSKFDLLKNRFSNVVVYHFQI